MTPFNIPPLALSHTLVFALYCVFGIGYHVANGKSYRHHWALPAHVSAGVAELVLYAVGRQISPIAVLLCFIQSATNLALTKHLQKGIPALTRTTYQAGGLFRPVFSLYALYTKRPNDYHDSVVSLHSFVYARVLLFLYSTISPSPNFEDNINSKQVYNLAIAASPLIAIGQSHLGVTAVLAYLLVVHVIGKISLWTRSTLAMAKDSHFITLSMAQAFAKIGFRTPDRERLDPCVGLSGNGPTIGRLSADELGHWYNAVGRGTCQYLKSGELVAVPAPADSPDKLEEVEWLAVAVNPVL